EDAVAGQPAIARVAPGKQPAIAGRRVDDRKGCAPPRLGLVLRVDERFDGARLAVACVAQQHSVGRASGHAHADGRLVAELVRAVDDVQLGAVVVRAERDLAHLVLRRDAHPLTEPAVSPPTIHFCRNRNRAVTGIIAINAPAVNGPHAWPYSSLMKPFIPTGSVKWSFVCSSAEAITYSLSVKTNEISATTTSTGVASGSTTPQKIWAGVAPSTRADSSSSFGIVSKKPFINQAWTPIAPPR